MDWEIFFGLKENPFGFAPDPTYYFPSLVHEESLQILQKAAWEQGGLFLLTGWPGSGKTLLLKLLGAKLGRDISCSVILNPRISPQDLCRIILEDLEPDFAAIPSLSLEELGRHLEAALKNQMDEGRKVFLIVDEAHLLPRETFLELCRLFPGEDPDQKFFKALLVGKSGLAEQLFSHNPSQSGPPVNLTLNLEPLSEPETEAYIGYRLNAAGYGGEKIFGSKVVSGIHQVGRGIPRLINIICERALIAAFVNEKSQVEEQHLEQAVKSVSNEAPPQPRVGSKKKGIVAGVLAAGVCLLLLIFLIGNPKPPQSEPSPESKPGPSAKTQVSVPVPSPPPVEKAEEKPPVMPAPPAEAIHIPLGKHLLSVDNHTKTARLWQGTRPDHLLKAEFRWEAPPPSGLYILGQSKKNRIYFFQYAGGPKPKNLKVPAEIWIEMLTLIQTRALPVISHPGPSRLEPEQVKEAACVLSQMSNWADSWRNKELEPYLSYYGPVLTACYLDDGPPLVYPKNKLRRIKKKTFSQTGRLELVVSEPVVLFDPTDHKKLMALFHQKYKDKSFADQGLKALFLKQGQESPQGPAWQIEAKFWSPE